jgi:hypothetical protein
MSSTYLDVQKDVQKALSLGDLEEAERKLAEFQRKAERKLAEFKSMAEELEEIELNAEDVIIRLAENLRKVRKRFIPLAVLALIAVPLAAAAEGFALYGVAANHGSAAITVVVTAGLLLGGALLLLPLLGWLRVLLELSY